MSGRVLNQSAPDSAPAAGVRVVAHRIGRTVQGPTDSTRTDRTGAFRLSMPADSEAVYLLSARHHGIEYFSAPFQDPSGRGADTVVLVVSDTSSTVLVRAPRRHIVIAPPTTERTREIVDLVTLETVGGRLTRVAPDSITPNWAGPLPPGVLDVVVGESDFSPDAVELARDSVFVFGPVAPGDKQLLLQYWIPVDRLTLLIPSSSDEMDLYIEGSGATATGPGLSAAAPEEIGGGQFSHWSGAVPEGRAVQVRLAPRGQESSALIVGLVSVMVLILAAAAFRLVRRPAPPRSAATSAELIDRLARLDAAQSSRREDPDREVVERYHRERAQLKREIAAALARERPPR